MLAASSVLILIAVVVWQVGQTFAKDLEATSANQVALAGQAETPYESVDWQMPMTDENGDILTIIGASDEDGISNIAGNVLGTLLYSYNTLTENGSYTQEGGEKIAEEVASTLHANVSYKIYTANDIETDSDTSYGRMLAYRAALQAALEPLLKNQGYELGMFANYIDTADIKYLKEIQATAANYRAAIEKTTQVIVPEDAAAHHVGILNALSQFASILEKMPQHGDDAFASAALLRTYQTSEADLFTSFNSLAGYYTSKQK